jgi:putative ABC transport system ATP-binding protein
MVEPASVRVEEVFKDFDRGLVPALRGLSFEVAAGEVVALTGASGCGKSTLLSLIGLLDRPSAGRIWVARQDLARVRDVYGYRAQTVGFVFQFHHMIPSMTLAENVEAPMVALGVRRAERRRRACGMLERVGLSHRVDFLPGRVSGGERQRAAVARALVNDPALILADEPTGNLDSANGARVIDLFISHARERGVTVLMATHNHDITAVADRVIELQDGRVAGIQTAGAQRLAAPLRLIRGMAP